MVDSEIKETMKKVFDSILDTIHMDGMKLRESLGPFICEKRLLESFKNNSPENYYFAAEYEIDKALDSLVESQYNRNRDITFIFRNYNFIERSFKSLVEDIEGSCCCADKSRTIVKCLIKHYLTGNEIKFNYEQEYTYHLPKTIFKNHESIVTFYQALKRLQYGRNDLYFQFFDENPEYLNKEQK